MKKIRSRRGETIIETLVSVLIISATFLFLTGAVTASARVNSRLKNERSQFFVDHTGESAVDAEVKIKFQIKGLPEEYKRDVVIHHSRNGYFQYYLTDSSGSAPEGSSGAG